jgi:chromosome transmission fidelity protein 18
MMLESAERLIPLTFRSYAPALRPLRPLAKIIRFNPPTPPMLIKRLRTICDVEGLSTENKHLSLLVDVAEGDLRSCLNTLQVRQPPH